MKSEKMPLKEMKRSFKEYILTEIKRDDIVGDLAGDIKRDPSFPNKTKSRLACRKYLIQKAVCKHVIDAFEEAYMDYQVEEYQAWCRRRGL
jgi:uncharacterized protein YozE (UPF0346 family)